MTSERPKTLVIADGDYHKEVDSRSRSEALSRNIPNTAEYDIVILDNIRRYLERGSSRLCVMTTRQLFDIYCKVKKGSWKREE